jgi:choline dehydrogenase-like flavoprotein
MVSNVFDVSVIGSGLAGRVFSKERADARAKVALVEAGGVIKLGDFHCHAWPYEFPRRQKPEPFYLADVRESVRCYEDYTDIGVDRIRAMGGRSVHWTPRTPALCLSISVSTAAKASKDWPLSYGELGPATLTWERWSASPSEDTKHQRNKYFWRVIRHSEHQPLRSRTGDWEGEARRLEPLIKGK